MLTEGSYAWRCVLCEAAGYGGAGAYDVHYRTQHTTREPTYIDYLREARNEHGLSGAAAYQWAHAAWAEYERNQ
jgi:hypothetical protein